jgi:undecaprenyl-phosphate 4-deoxy-4-formamido-L-arabinose transferase
MLEMLPVVFEDLEGDRSSRPTRTAYHRDDGPVTSPSISVVVPVYNSAGSLPELVNRLNRVLPTTATEYELILVNDGSPDNSSSVIGRLSLEFQWVRGIELSRNFGQHNALLCGIRSANYPLVVTIDDDLQHPPEVLPALLSCVEQGYDVVYGTPETATQGRLRNLASSVAKRGLQVAMQSPIATQVSAFRVFRTDLRDAFADYTGHYVNLDVLLSWGTTAFGAVTVRHDARKYGRSNYSLARLAKHTFNLVTGFTTLPLQVASLLGLACTLFGAVILTFVVGRFLLQGGAPAGFTFLASVIAIFAGVQLFALGLIGEYVARLYHRSMQRPSYVIKSRS